MNIRGFFSHEGASTGKRLLHESTLKIKTLLFTRKSKPMVAVVSCLPQKGAVAKSALAWLIAREYASVGRGPGACFPSAQAVTLS